MWKFDCWAVEGNYWSDRTEHGILSTNDTPLSSFTCSLILCDINSHRMLFYVSTTVLLTCSSVFSRLTIKYLLIFTGTFVHHSKQCSWHNISHSFPRLLLSWCLAKIATQLAHGHTPVLFLPGHFLPEAELHTSPELSQPCSWLVFIGAHKLTASAVFWSHIKEVLVGQTKSTEVLWFSQVLLPVWTCYARGVG